MQRELGASDALVLVDVQRDFCTGGPMPVSDGESVLAVLRGWLAHALAARTPVIAARDWHPPDHCSFLEQGGPLPAHCVRDTPGAAVPASLDLGDALIVDKGTRPDRDSASAFDDTGLAGLLHARGVERLWIGGLGQDAGVRAAVLDACDAGFETLLIPGGSSPFETRPGDGQRAVEAMRAAGACVATR